MEEILCIHKPRKCPKCGGKVARIFYGMPAFTEKLQADLDAGRVILGGCCLDDRGPTWQCTKCGQEFYKVPAGVHDDLARGSAIYDFLMDKYKGTDYGSILALLPYAVQNDLEKLEFFIIYSHTHGHRLKICYPGKEQEPDASKILYIGAVTDGYMYIKK